MEGEHNAFDSRVRSGKSGPYREHISGRRSWAGTLLQFPAVASALDERELRFVGLRLTGSTTKK